MSYLLECALRELTRRKWRSAAGVLGYLLAVATLVVLLGTLSASKAAANSAISRCVRLYRCGWKMAMVRCASRLWAAANVARTSVGWWA